VRRRRGPRSKGISPRGGGAFRPDTAEILKVNENLAENKTGANRTSPDTVAGAQFAVSAGAEAVAFQQMIRSLFNGTHCSAALSFFGNQRTGSDCRRTPHHLAGQKRRAEAL
jgi:hypothetical protein